MRCYQPVRLWSQGIEVPCGHCAACLANRQQDWITRLSAEFRKEPTKAYFVTLTYSDEYLPIDENGNPYARVKDVQNFHKRLRRHIETGTLTVPEGYPFFPGVVLSVPFSKFLYWVASEYGEDTLRPHFHGLYFGLPEDPYITECLIRFCWKSGFVEVSRMTEGRINYATKYLLDNKVQPFIPSTYAKPVRLSSRGLGVSLLSPGLLDWWRLSPHNRVYVPDHGDKKRLGRYLKDKIFDSDMKARISEVYSSKNKIFSFSELLALQMNGEEYERQVRNSLNRKKYKL